MRYLSEILKRLGCNYDWFTFWVGRSLDLIETSEVTQYAEMVLCQEKVQVKQRTPSDFNSSRMCV